MSHLEKILCNRREIQHVMNHLDQYDCLNLAKSCKSLLADVYKSKHKFLLNRIIPNPDQIVSVMIKDDPTLMSYDQIFDLYLFLTSSVEEPLHNLESKVRDALIDWIQSWAMKRDAYCQHLWAIINLHNIGNRFVHSKRESLQVCHSWIKSSIQSDPDYLLGQIDFVSTSAQISGNHTDVIKKYQIIFDESKHPLVQSFAMIEIGKCYRFGYDCEPNFHKAIKCYEFAAQHRIPNAQNTLAIMSENTINVKKDLQYCEHLFKAAISGGCFVAHHNLAVFYQNQGKYDRSLEYHRRAVQCGYAPSMHLLGEYYMHGIKGCELHPYCAAGYFEEAIKRGYSKSATLLAKMYLNWGPWRSLLLIDLDKGFQILYDAIKMNDVDPSCYLGLSECYADGKGCEKNQHLASYYKQLAFESDKTGLVPK